MKTLALGIVGALGGVSFCIGTILLTDATGLAVVFPSPAGEEDFDLRFRCFLFGLLPAFLFFGTWVGVTFAQTRRGGLTMVIGSLIGTTAHFSLLRLARGIIQSISGSTAANLAAVASLVSWIGLVLACAAGARSFYDILRSRSNHLVGGGKRGG